MTDSPLNPPSLDYASPAAVKQRPWLRPRNIMLGLLVAFVCFVIWGVGTFVYVSNMIHHNMEKAEAHAVVLRPAIASDPRFLNQVKLEGFTGGNGSLLIHGYVYNKADLAALQQIVSASQPPVPVMWNVSIVRATTTTIAPAVAR